MTKKTARDPILYVDCTSTFRGGLNTGVQRVVRALISQKAVFEEVLQLEFVPICYQFNGFYRLDDAEQITLTTEAAFTAVDFCLGDVYLCPDAFWTMGMCDWFKFMKDRGVSVAVVIYDLIPLVRPDFVAVEDSKSFEWALREAAVKSDMLFCISHATKCDLEDFFNREGLAFSSELCQVIPLAPALSTDFQTIDINDERLPQDPFFLMVGTVEPRRGYVEAIEEFLLYRESGGAGSLLIVGKAGSDSQKILQLIQMAGPSIVWMDDVDDVQLLKAYKRALAVVCASRIEGYGMSVSEGLAHNGLVFANRLPVFGEFAGSLPYYFDIDRTGDLSRLLTVTPDLKRPSVIASLGSWQKTALEIAKSLTSISRSHGSHQAIEITRNSAEAVRWTHWLLKGSSCNQEDFKLWLAYKTVSEMFEAFRFEQRQLDAPLTADAVRWAQALLNLRVDVTNKEVEDWRSICKNVEQLRAHLMHEQRQLDAPLTADAVRWLQMAINGRLGVGDDEVEYWQQRCGKVAILRETLLNDRFGAHSPLD